MRFKKAFTMAEAILVMVILGIIATIMISTMRPVEFRDRGFKVLANFFAILKVSRSDFDKYSIILVYI